MPRVRGHALAVQRVGGAGQGGAAQGQHVDALAHVQHALGIALEHFHIGQQVVAKAHGLGHLQVGKAGQDHVHIASRPLPPGPVAAPAAGSSIRSISPRSHRRTSVATWSLRLRPVCRRLPASPTSAVRRASMFRCTSSRSSFHSNCAGFDLLRDLGHALLDGGVVSLAQ